MHKEKHCGKIGMVAIILACMILSGCTGQDTTDTPAPTGQPNPPDYSNPVDLIPIQLTEVSEFSAFPDPISASFDSTEPLDGVHIPGGYGGREWLTDKEFVLSMVMDFESSEEATHKLDEVKPGEAIPIDVGDEGYKAEELLADGSPGFRLVVWRRGGFLAVVGGGILDVLGTVPSEQSLIDLAHAIDQNISSRTHNSEKLHSLSSKKKSLPPSASLSIASPLLLSPTNFQAGGESKRIKKPLIKSDGTVNGSITIRFDIVVIKEDKDKMCDLLEIRVYIEEICLGDDDGDGWLRGKGDIQAGGAINFYFECNNTLKQESIQFATGELGDIGPNECLTLNKFLERVQGWQDKCTRPTATYDILVQDNDAGDVIDIIMVLEPLVLKKGAGEDKAKGAEKGKDAMRDRGQDTTGASVGFNTMRERARDELGEAHTGTEPTSLQTVQLDCPDIVVETLTPNPATPHVGDKVRVTVRIKNQGTIDVTKPFSINFYVDGKKVASSVHKDGLKKGGEEFVDIEFETTFTEESDYKIKVHADPKDEIKEPEEDDINNRKEIQLRVTVAKVPDLTIPSIRVAKEPPSIDQNIYPGDTVAFYVTVTNVGNGAAGKFAVTLDPQFILDIPGGGFQEPEEIPSLNPGESRVVKFTFVFPAPGSYSFLAMADSSKNVTESVEENNTKPVTVTVKSEPLPGLPDLMVSYVKVYYEYKEPGEGEGEVEKMYLTKVDFTVVNIGNGDSDGNIEVRIWLDDDSNVIYKGIVRKEPLPSGQQFTMTIPIYGGWSVEPPNEPHNLGVFVVPSNTIVESREENNTLVITFPEGHSILLLGHNMCCSVKIDVQECQFIPKELLF